MQYVEDSLYFLQSYQMFFLLCIEAIGLYDRNPFGQRLALQYFFPFNEGFSICHLFLFEVRGFEYVEYYITI
jgi:hypothetical protein